MLEVIYCATKKVVTNLNGAHKARNAVSNRMLSPICYTVLIHNLNIKDCELELFILLRPRPPYFVFCSSVVRVPPAYASPLETPARHSTCGTAPGSGRQSQQPTHRGRGGKTNTPLSWVEATTCSKLWRHSECRFAAWEEWERRFFGLGSFMRWGGGRVQQAVSFRCITSANLPVCKWGERAITFPVIILTVYICIAYLDEYLSTVSIHVCVDWRNSCD